MKKSALLLIAVGMLDVFAGCNTPDAPVTPDDQIDLPASAASQIDSLLAEKAARTPAQRKISSQLLYAASGRFVQPDVKDPSKAIRPLAQSDKLDRVLVDIKGDVASTVITSLGGEVARSSAHATRAWLPLGSLETIAASSTVRSIAPAFAATTNYHDRTGIVAPKFRVGTREERIAAMQLAQSEWTAPPQRSELVANVDAAPSVTGSVTSQGVTAHGVTRAQKFYNATGAGVRVGVLSDSDDFKEASIASGDLPATTVTIPGQDGRPGNGEGTAMMQIVHDLAPDADLVFATAFNSPASFADNIRQMRFTYHCDVIVDDIIYYFESPYEDDVIAQAVNDVVADGAMYFSSAGNAGNVDDGTSGVWEGDYKAAGTLATLPSGYTVHNFGNKVISDRIEVGGGPLYLHWSDPGTLANPASSNDYDLFVLDNDLRNVAVASTDIQDGTGLPFEYLGFNIPAGYRVVIARKADAETRAVRVVIGNGEFGLATAGGTYGHNSAAGGFGVAAVDVVEAAGGEFTGGATTPVETYSSDGPRRIFYNPDNSPINGSVTFAGGGGESRNKPDLAAADGVATTLPSGSGLNPFFGTSAAAPHAAAIAALVKGAVPTATNAQIKAAMLAGAIDIEASGADRDSGRGIANAFTSLQKAHATPAVYLEASSITVTPTTTYLLPGGSAAVALQIVNNGGAKATAVSATMTTTTPGVTITNGFASYGTILAGATGSTATAFSFTVSAATMCGSRVDFALTVNYTGNGSHPRVFTFSAQVGRPDAVFATTSYGGASVAIPDGDAAGVNIPFAVTGGTIADLRFHLDGTACDATAGSTTVGLDHSWVGDLTMSLESPAGTTVTLMSRPGGANNSGNNFCQTVLADTAATSIQDIAAADAPWTGTFKPASPLSSFASESASGTWVLHVSDSVSIDSGSVRAFGVDVAGFTCTP